ncbi:MULTISPECIES: hypothetical protein [unclassified Moraxella]|uniref:hypothetical protein n=1 Tax=unclassified Moraxella TaxID=2685852 RepID=UPI003AF9EBC9
MQETNTKVKAMLKDAVKDAVMLEFVEQEDGKMVLRASDEKDQPWVSIEFSDKVKEMLGGDTQFIGQHMIHAAIQSFMQKQMSHYHAHVHDVEPEHFS